MSENYFNPPTPQREYNPAHVSRYGLREVTKDDKPVIVHETNNLKELYEAFWRQNQEEIPIGHNPVQDAYLKELTNTGNGLRMCRVLDSLKKNPGHAELFAKLDEIAELRYRIQEAKAAGRDVEIDYLERDLWYFHHSKLFDVLIPGIQELDPRLDPYLFLR